MGSILLSITEPVEGIVMSRRTLTWTVFLAFLMVPFGALFLMLRGFQENISNVKPDVLLITIDTCREDAIGGYGNHEVNTPFIDSLIRNSVQFYRGYAPAPTTAPSHATLLTGRQPGEHGVFRNGMVYEGAYPTLATILGDYGYQTAAFVSGYSLVGRVSGLSKGFQLYDDAWSEHQVERNCEDTTKAFSDWYKKIEPQPFFSWVHLFDPHSPYDPPEIYVKMMRNPEGNDQTKPKYSQEIINKYQKNIENARKAKDFGVLIKDPTTTRTDISTMQSNWSNYLGEICRVDRCISRIIDCIKRSGRYHRTLILLTSDHGEGFDHEYFFGHGDRLWESAIRVPWIIRYPLNTCSSSISRTVIRHHDVLPTILHLTHSNAFLQNLYGENLDFQIRTGLPRTRISFTALAPPLPRASLSQGLLMASYDSRFKLIRNELTGEMQLFDLMNDPGELNDCAAQWPKVLKRLSHEIDRYRMKFSIPETSDMPDLDKDTSQKLKQLGYID
jgi:arylsulfatase A-like enzyme